MDASYTMRSKAGGMPGPGVGEFDELAQSSGHTFKFVNCKNKVDAGFISIQGNNAADRGLRFKVLVAIQDAARLELCPQFEWKYSEWSEWDHSCDKATRTRSAYCVMMQTAERVDASYCSVNDNLITTETTNFGPCAWSAYPWSTCSEYCGGGTQTRIVECRNRNGVGNRVLDMNCVDRPVESRACNT